jgi:hypothetical protein
MPVSKHQNYCKNIFGKSYTELTQSDWDPIFVLFNALVDSYPGDLSKIKEKNLMLLFTSQCLPNPMHHRIPRQKIRDFLKQFSIKKYGCASYYDRLMKQGIIW